MEVFVLPDDRRLQERWKDIAERVSKEQDSQKLSELTNELIHALDERTSIRKSNLEDEQRHTKCTRRFFVNEPASTGTIA
jgi:hypothetical protein